MALLNTITNEYIRIDFDNTYINKDGIMCKYIKYVSQDERKKEQDRINEINKFLVELKKYTNLDTLKQSDLLQEEDKNNCSVLYFTNIYELFLNYNFYFLRALVDNDSNIICQYALVEQYNKTLYDVLKKIGFKEEWYTNPVKIRVPIFEYIKIADYEKQDFTLETFYALLKDILKEDFTIVNEENEESKFIFEDC